MDDGLPPRQRRVLNLIQKERIKSAHELAATLAVSRMTIYRDLLSLSRRGLVTIVRGGAVIRSFREFDPGVSVKAMLRRNAKEKIASTVARLELRTGISVVLEAGSTVSQIANFMFSANAIRIYSNGLEVVREVARNAPGSIVQVIPGELKAETLSIVGKEAEQYCRSLRFDLGVFSAEAFGADGYLEDPDPREVRVKQAMAFAAERKILLLDSSKLGRTSVHRFSHIREFDMVYTEAVLPPIFSRLLQRYRVECTVADSSI